MSRKTAREITMKLCYASMFGDDTTIDSVLEDSEIFELPTQLDAEYTKDIMNGIKLHIDEIEALIKELSIGWRIERMPKVDIAILRIAIYEMLYRKDISYSVSINEAVELAKTYGGSDKSSAYINGILGTLAKRLESVNQA